MELDRLPLVCLLNSLADDPRTASMFSHGVCKSVSRPPLLLQTALANGFAPHFTCVDPIPFATNVDEVFGLKSRGIVSYDRFRRDRRDPAVAVAGNFTLKTSVQNWKDVLTCGVA